MLNKKLIISSIFLLVVTGVLAHITFNFYESPTPLNYYYFDGNDFINVSHSDSLNISNGTEGITISAWVKWEEYSCFRRIVAKSPESLGPPYTMFGLLEGCNSSSYESPGKKNIRMEIAGEGFQHFVPSSTYVEEDVWYHIVGTYNNSDGGKMYINGALDSSNLYNTTSYSPFTIVEVDNITGGNIDTNDNPLSIGSSNFGGSTSDFFKGSIDEVKVFNRSLSASEVLELYNYGYRNESYFSTANESLVAYYPLNDTNPLDYSGNANDGVKDGTTLFQSDHVFYNETNIKFTGDENRTYWIFVDKDANFTAGTFNLTGDGIGDKNLDFSSQDTLLNSGTGITTNGTDFWVIDTVLDKIYHYNSGLSLIDSYDAGASNFENGIEYYNNNIYAPINPNIVRKFTNNLNFIQDYTLYELGRASNILHNGTNFLISDTLSDAVYIYDNDFNYVSVLWDFAESMNTYSSLTEKYYIVDASNLQAYNSDLSLYHSFDISSKVSLEDAGATAFGTDIFIVQGTNLTKYDINQLTTNPEIFLSNISIWDYTGEYDSEETTSDFSSELNTSINEGNCDCEGCILQGETCSIPLIFHSDTSGILEFSDININWLEYENPKINITEPSGEYISTEIPYSINASDNWETDTCIFWVTRGASLEVSNTSVDCSENISGNTYVSSIFTNYTFHFWVNDTSGNSNYSNSSFSTTEDAIVITPPTGGGGGGGVIITEEEEEESKNCEIYRQPLTDALRELVENTNEDNWFQRIKNVWNAFWDRVLCDSAGSIVPIQ